MIIPTYIPSLLPDPPHASRHSNAMSSPPIPTKSLLRTFRLPAARVSEDSSVTHSTPPHSTAHDSTGHSLPLTPNGTSALSTLPRTPPRPPRRNTTSTLPALRRQPSEYFEDRVEVLRQSAEREERAEMRWDIRMPKAIEVDVSPPPIHYLATEHKLINQILSPTGRGQPSAYRPLVHRSHSSHSRTSSASSLSSSSSISSFGSGSEPATPTRPPRRHAHAYSTSSVPRLERDIGSRSGDIGSRSGATPSST
jgi:hypothetical protein